MKRAKVVKSAEEPAAASEVIAVRIAIEDDNSFEPVYANFAEVARSQYEIEIRFIRTPAKLSSEQMMIAQSGEPVVVQPLAKVLIPMAVAESLAEAILKQVADFKENPNAKPIN